MRTDVDHLPANKQRELERVKAIIFEEFEDAIALATMSWKKKGRIEKLILYGSYARGGWVDEPHTAKGYRSDFDLLIIVNDKRLTERVDFWLKLEDRLIRELAIDKTLHTPVNFIVHTLQEVNDGLAHGRVFFMEVAKDGIALYEADESELAKPKPKTPDEALKTAREYFEEGMAGAMSRQKLARYALAEGLFKDAAFDFHQTTERLYSCLLLTLTYYTPYNHNIAFLRSLAEGLDRRLHGVWPETNRGERAMFQKLKEAYTKARYSRQYRISEEELIWLGARVEELGRIVHLVCTDKIEELETVTRK